MDSVDAELNIVVKTIQNNEYNLTITKSMTILSLKTLIKNSTEIDEDRQRLIYKGRVLLDSGVVQDYNIEDGHTVHMVARPVNYRELQSNDSNASTVRDNATDQMAQQQQHNATQAAIMNIIGGNAAATPQPPSSSSTMEHIRQSLLTMHTLASTMQNASYNMNQQTPAFNSNNHTDNNSGSLSSGIAEERNQRRFYVGQWVDVKDTVNQWLEATVMDIDEHERKIFVHYNGWPVRWDEWIEFDSPRVSPFRSRTTHNSNSNPYLCPLPNISVDRAPLTGVNDVRTLLPHIALWMRSMLPLVEEAAALSEESLRMDPPESLVNYRESALHNRNATDQHVPITLRNRSNNSITHTTHSYGIANNGMNDSGLPRYARGMPWEYVGQQYDSNSNNVEGEGSGNTTGRVQASVLPCMSHDDGDEDEELCRFDPNATREKLGITPPRNKQLTNQGNNQCGDADNNSLNQNSAINFPLHDDNLVQDIDINGTGSTHRSNEERENRLQQIIEELCPLFDRYGRILSDFSPLLSSYVESHANIERNPEATDPHRATQSLENSILNLLRERPPSPPPLRAYRAPLARHNGRLVSAPAVGASSNTSRAAGVALLADLVGLDLLSGGNSSGGGNGTAPQIHIIRAIPGNNQAQSNSSNEISRSTAGDSAVSSSVPTNDSTTDSSSNVGATSSNSYATMTNRTPNIVSPVTRHVDIHIGIFTPASNRAPALVPRQNTIQARARQSNQSPNDRHEQYNALTASLQQQARSLAARTRELSERTSQVSSYTAAIGDILRSLNTTVSNNATVTNAENTDSNNAANTDSNNAVNTDAVVASATSTINDDNRCDDFSIEGSSHSDEFDWNDNTDNNNNNNNTQDSEGDSDDDSREGAAGNNNNSSNLLDDLLPPNGSQHEDAGHSLIDVIDNSTEEQPPAFSYLAQLNTTTTNNTTVSNNGGNDSNAEQSNSNNNEDSNRSSLFSRMFSIRSLYRR